MLEKAIQTMLNGDPVGWWEPTYKMLKPVWRDMKEILIETTRSKDESGHRLELRTGGSIDFWSFDSEETARGNKYKRAILDESALHAGLFDDWERVIRPTLADLRGDAWIGSTPRGRNGFHKLHLRGRDPDNPEWKSWTFTTYDNPYILPAEIEAMKQGMTEDAFRQEILAEFLEDSGSVFRKIEDAMHAPKHNSPTEHEGHNLAAGIDWAKENDYTAISIGCATCRREVYIDRFNQIDYAFQVQRIKQALTMWKVRSAIPELNSMGSPIFETLQRMGLPVTGFTMTAASKPPLIEELALTLEEGDFQFIGDDTWTAELEAYERKVNQTTGRSSYNAPPGYNDDTVIARALMKKGINKLPRENRIIKNRKSPLADL